MCLYVYYLVGGLEHFLFPFHIWDVILPIDELIFFRGVGIPPTSFCCHRKMGNVVFGEEKLFFLAEKAIEG